MRVNPIPQKAVAVIFAGGKGSRLWPVSTEALPKQLNTAFSKKTLLGETFERVAKLFPVERIIIVTTQALAERAKEIIALPEKNWIIEPENADTAAAMCLTALHLQTLFPESMAMLFYSDHKIGRFIDFKKVVRAIERVAHQHAALITIGTRPTSENTQLGYIQLGAEIAPHVHEVVQFKEKPDKATAHAYVESGKYVWNTGLYVWQTKVLLAAVKELAPEYYEALLRLKVLIGSAEYEQAVAAWFASLHATPFERLISERISRMLVYVADYEWEDVGNWKAVYSLARKDANKNAVVGEQEGQKVRFMNAKGNLVFSNARRVVLAGVENIFVIETEDALLVCNKDEVVRFKEEEEGGV